MDVSHRKASFINKMISDHVFVSDKVIAKLLVFRIMAFEAALAEIKSLGLEVSSPKIEECVFESLLDATV